MAHNHTAKYYVTDEGSNSNSNSDNLGPVKVISYEKKETDEGEYHWGHRDNAGRAIRESSLDNVEEIELNEAQKKEREDQSRHRENTPIVQDVHGSSTGGSSIDVNKGAINIDTRHNESEIENAHVEEGAYNKVDVNLAHNAKKYGTKKGKIQKHKKSEKKNIHVQGGSLNEVNVVLPGCKDGDSNGKYKYSSDRKAQNGEKIDASVINSKVVMPESSEPPQSSLPSVARVILENVTLNAIGNKGASNEDVDENKRSSETPVEINISNANLNFIGNSPNPKAAITGDIEIANSNLNKIGNRGNNVASPVRHANRTEKRDGMCTEIEQKNETSLRHLNIAIAIFVFLWVIFVIALIVVVVKYP